MVLILFLSCALAAGGDVDVEWFLHGGRFSKSGGEEKTGYGCQHKPGPAGYSAGTRQSLLGRRNHSVVGCGPERAVRLSLAAQLHHQFDPDRAGGSMVGAGVGREAGSDRGARRSRASSQSGRGRGSRGYRTVAATIWACVFPLRAAFYVASGAGPLAS